MTNITLKEIIGILWCSIFFGFVFAINDFGEPASLECGIKNILISAGINFVVLLCFIFLIKFIADKMGYFVEFLPSIIADIVFLYITFMSYGFIQIVTTGIFNISACDEKRIGKYREGPNLKDFFIISIRFMLLSAFFLILLKIFISLFLVKFVELTVLKYILKAFVLLPVGFFIPIPKSLGYYVFTEMRGGFFSVFLPYFVFMLGFGFLV